MANEGDASDEGATGTTRPRPRRRAAAFRTRTALRATRSTPTSRRISRTSSRSGTTTTRRSASRPSSRVGQKEGAVGEFRRLLHHRAGSHTGLHNDNVEEIAFVAEGEGEVFSIGKTQPLEAGKFLVFAAGADHDIYARGSVALRLLSFFPTPEIVSTFQQAVYPLGETTVSSKPPPPVVTELDPNNLPGKLPVHARRARDGAGERGAARAQHDAAPDRDDRPEQAAGERRGEDLHARRGPGDRDHQPDAEAAGGRGRAPRNSQHARAWRNWQTRRV